MGRRWQILAVLTFARTAMGFQFQSVTAASADLSGALSLSNTAIGLLIGVYQFPGILLAVPGGWVGQRFGDKQAVLTGLAMMAAGAILSVAGGEWTALLAGRILSGVGAVLLNVLLTKMVADWFSPRDLPTAMGLLIVSWPLGIALAMVTIPAASAAAGWQPSFLATGIAALACLALVWQVYEPAGEIERASVSLGLPRRELVLAVLVGLVWALYNVGLIGLLSFGPAFMIAGGSDPIAAQATVSAVSWLILPTLAVAGWTTVRTGRPDLILVLGVVATAALILLLPFAGGSVLLFGAIGFMFGIPGPVIVTLPVRAVSAARRGIGFGIFYALNYSGMAVTGPIGGWLLDTTGSATAPIWFSGLALLTSLVPLGMFHLMSRRTPVAN